MFEVNFPAINCGMEMINTQTPGPSQKTPEYFMLKKLGLKTLLCGDGTLGALAVDVEVKVATEGATNGRCDESTDLSRDHSSSPPVI